MTDFTKTTLEILSPLFPKGSVHVKRLTGHQGISSLFEYRVEIIVTDKSLHVGPDNLQGESVSLVIQESGQAKSQIHGMVASLKEQFDVSLDHDQFELIIVPHLWQLTTIKLQEVYIDQSVPDLIRHKIERANLGKEGVDYEFNLHTEYPKQPFIIQYDESDFDFISRLAEDVGISYYFIHSDASDAYATDKVVFCDTTDSFPIIDSTPWVPFSTSGQKVGLFELERSDHFVPFKFWVRDYSYHAPQVDLQSATETPSGTVMGATIEYGNYFSSVAEGQSIVTVRAEEAASKQTRYRGRSDLLHLSAGRIFGVDNLSKIQAPLLILRVEHEYVQTVKSHDGEEQDRFYINAFEAIPADRNFRPPRRTRIPTIPGVVTGFIVSEANTTRDTLPSSAQADIDERGRYLVEFHLDTPGDSTSTLPSKRIRMAQPASGANFGFNMPLRPGTEVMIGFINGDLRRPVILGAVHNATSPDLVTSNDPTKSRIRTQTGLMIEFCDAPDAE